MDYKLISYQILLATATLIHWGTVAYSTVTIRIAQSIVRRISNEILGVKGLVIISTLVTPMFDSAVIL